MFRVQIILESVKTNLHLLIDLFALKWWVVKPPYLSLTQLVFPN